MRRVILAILLGIGVAVAALRAPSVPVAAAQTSVHIPAPVTLIVKSQHSGVPINLHAVSQEKMQAQIVHRYTVQPGDTLSAIAKRLYGNSGAWVVLYWSNHSHIRWANEIQPGLVLIVPPLPTVLPAAPAALAPAPLRTSISVLSSATPAPVQLSASGPWPGGAFGACVVMRESGGNSQVMNATGHYGLYQFSLGTWEAYGGSAALFGRASIAYQEQIFMNALARGGQSNWSAYDGC